VELRPVSCWPKDIDQKKADRVAGQAREHAARRVLVIKDQSLFSAGVLSLLAREADLQVLGVSYTEQAALIDEVERFEPDVVLFERQDRDPVLCVLLDHHLGPCILTAVEMNAEQAGALVYERKPAVIAGVADLLALISRG
jgi:DNA-binding NarL/FixJ family response regulator